MQIKHSTYQTKHHTKLWCVGKDSVEECGGGPPAYILDGDPLPRLPMGGQGHHTSRSSTQLLLLGYRYVTAIKPNGSFTFFVWKNIQQLLSNFIFIYRKHTLTWKPSKAARLKRKAIIWTTNQKSQRGLYFTSGYHAFFRKSY